MLRRIMQVMTLLTAVTGVGVVGAGCLDRPIVSAQATTTTNFTTAQQANSINKVDLLFDIDNSASMGDKQIYLEQAVPDLINRLVNPNCVDSTTGVSSGSSMSGVCTMYPGTTSEFPPVHDMHIGIISSSLGTRGVTGAGAVCDPTNTNDDSTGMFLDGMPALPTHVDDQAHLLNRTATGMGNALFETEGVSMDVGGQNFLDWFPTDEANVGFTAGGTIPAVLTPAAAVLTVPGTLESDFAALVAGTHTYGCGIESQLETWYRFLIQPDPYASIGVTSGGLAEWVGVDKTIIQQRHDFLRPDSLVAILVLTDENDSEIDVRSFGGQGYRFMDQGPPAGQFTPPRGTAICQTDPGSPDCTSCAYPGHSTDTSCAMGDYTKETDWGFYINVRHVHMKQKYGIVPQFPLQRYVLGMTSPKVPDRNGEYPPGASSYQGGTNSDPSDLDCQNPLFAATLPDGNDLTAAALCNTTAAAGTRSPNLVFYAHIGGVPHQLLQTLPGDKDMQGNYLCTPTTNAADCPQKDTLAVSDWTKILGAGATGGGTGPYDYIGIDPHMIENYDPPRTGTAYNTGAVETIVTGGPQATGGGPDPINGRDWTTDGTNASGQPDHTLPVDREYACIFPLASPRDCSKASQMISDPINSYACDCEAAGLPLDSVPAVCGLQDSTAAYAVGTNDYLSQYYAKTYPTIRELTLANLMGPQGIISSLCPIHVTDMEGGNDPLYGYRPAITAIVDRLKNALASQCLPQPLNQTPDDAGQLEVPCLILATIANSTTADEATECNGTTHPGLTTPASAILSTFNANQHAQYMTNMVGTDLSTEATCQVAQISVPKGGTCIMAGSPARGWCYVTGPNAGTCDTQAILFTPSTLPNGATVNLQCILANSGDGGM